MDTRVKKSDRVAFRETRTGGVLLHLDSGQYHQVNEIGGLIWSLADGRTVEEIAAGVRSRVEDPPPDLGEDVQAFVNDLTERDLLVLEQN
jgi:hypothetical protein